jgi:ribose transport system ATP-binding protein
VHQDLALIPSLSVAENLQLGDLATRGGWRISWARERARAREALRRHGVELDPEAPVATLRAVDRALVAIVRAVETIESPPEGLLVLDEPTAFLPRRDTERLFGLVRRLASSGSSVLFVSHDLGETLEIADRITVLRDGRVVATLSAGTVSRRELVGLITGHAFEPLAASRPPRPAADLLGSVHELSGAGVQELSLELGRGEVLGVTGLAGSGYEDVPYLLFGARAATGGRLTLNGVSHDLRSLTPEQALLAGVALVPGDRQREGSVGALSLGDNVMLPALDRYASRLRLDRRRLSADARAVVERFDVRPADPRLPYEALSGGNQQKALVAKWLNAGPRLLLLDEPTRGVDVGAREQVLALVRSAAARGVTVLCASGDHEQLAAVCDRVLVFSDGRATSELTDGEVTKERIAARCYAG